MRSYVRDSHRLHYRPARHTRVTLSCARAPRDLLGELAVTISPALLTPAYALDALLTLACDTGPGRPADHTDPTDGTPGTRTRQNHNPTFLAPLRVHLAALTRGAPEGNEICEITGTGPISARVARDLLGDSILKLVITRGVDVANVTHLGRGASTAQRVALLWRSPTCSVEGCNRTRIEIDHRTPWATAHHTRLDQLDPLCKHHHHQKHQHLWALTEGTGTRPMVPPTDPRHPLSTHDPTESEPTHDPP